MVIRYEIGNLRETTKPLTGYTLVIAETLATGKATSNELASREPFTRQTLEGIIKIIANSQGFSKHISTNEVFRELVESGFLNQAGP